MAIYKRKRSSTRGRRRVRRRTVGMSSALYKAKRSFARSEVAMKRTLYDTSWIFSTGSTNGFWRYQTFTAGTAINNFAELAAVFDEYKILKIKQTFRPRYDNVAVPTGAGSIVQPQAYAHVVLDPQTTLSTPTGVYSVGTVNTFLEQGGVRTYTLNKPFSVYFTPMCSSATGSGGTMVRSPWLKTTNTGEQFRGFHCMLQQNNMDVTNTNIILDSFITVYFKCRGLK